MDEQLRRLHRAREKMPNYRHILELAEKLLEEKCRVKKRWPSAETLPGFLKAKNHVPEGFPYLRPAELALDTVRMQEYFSHLLGILEKQDPSRHRALINTLESRGFIFDRFLESLLDNQVTEGRLEQEWGEQGSLLFFFAVQSLKPAFEAHAEAWRGRKKGLSFAQGFCPFCGGFPALGEIREEGRRVLHCPLCATEWDYPRMKCPFCENEDQEQLTYFQVEGEVGYRVDICLRCRSYLKTVDSREQEGPLNWEVEDYLTLHLDQLAQEEGYTRPQKLFVEAR